jgi:hypothetical protein
MILIFPTIALVQVYHVMPIWIQQHVAPQVGNVHIPILWHHSMFSLSSVVIVPLLCRKRRQDRLVRRKKFFLAGNRESTLCSLDIGQQMQHAPDLTAYLFGLREPRIALA